MYDRLIACGFTPRMAKDTIALYADERNLRAYVHVVEHFYASFRDV